MAGFVGFAPVGDPKIAVYVGVFEPHEKSDPNAHGNRHAGPVFKEVIETTLQHLNVAPDATASKN
jgi:penicillin-binding protein 2B